MNENASATASAVLFLAVLGSCSAGKDPFIRGGGSVAVNSRLQMVVTHVEIQAMLTVGNADQILSKEYNHVMFLSLPKGAKFGSGGGGSVEEKTTLDKYPWTGGTITVACDYSKRCGTINGEPFSLVGGNILLVSLDEKGIPSLKGQFPDDTKYLSSKSDGSTNYSASTDFLELLSKKYPAVADFIQISGGHSINPKLSPGTTER